MDAQTKKALRKRLYVDDIQKTMIVRTILHWYFYMSAILLVVCLGAVWLDPSKLAIKRVFEAFVYFSPAVVASVFLLPLVVWDMLKTTNRIAGPVYRLRCEMEKLTAGEDVEPLKFRDGDAFEELAEEFNRLAETVKSERKAAKQNESESLVGA